MGARIKITKFGAKLLVITFGDPAKYNYNRNFAVKHADGVATRILGRNWVRVWSTNEEAAYTLLEKDKRRKKDEWV